MMQDATGKRWIRIMAMIEADAAEEELLGDKSVYVADLLIDEINDVHVLWPTM